MNNQKPQLIYVVNNLCVGGVTEIVKNTCKELSKKYDIAIVSLGNDISGWANKSDIRINCFEVKIEYKYSLFDYFKDMVIGNTIKKNYQEVINYLIQEKPDILHFHTLPRFLKIGILVKRKIPCKLVFTDHLVRIGASDYSPLIRLLLGEIYRHAYKAYHLIFVSKSVQDVAYRYHFIGKGRKHIRIDNGINIRLYPYESKETNGKIIFIYVARISPVKGHVELIKSWANIKSDINRELWLVGPNEMGKTLQKLIKQTGCNNIKMLGSRNDIKELLSAADIGVFPSSKEGLPLSLLEKMAMNLPVIVSNIDELTSVIEHEKDGLVYELGNNKDLTAKMSILLDNKAMREKLGKQARKKIEENYSILTVIKKIKNFYQSL